MKTYTIKKGSHYSGFRFWPLFNTKKMKVRVRFHPSCLYVPVARQGINKLFGFSEGFNHMENSRRIGWTSDGQVIILHTFDHVNGEMIYTSFRNVRVNEWVDLTITTDKPSFFGYRLYPYFGGQLPAPHEMKIDMEWL